ncbi:rRNA processing protein [Penicillium angulare]|uniref:rRNA processing protein n=1 Tax=Penicillium angulare TaxID=116970 RepID=UPI0025414FCE|nr:rRNA processing protein [Penicillium angulare]KAJ5280508.1 rRNA processing protein [Penicillium angulare]
MRAKRSKKYRKLMHQYEMTFGFREPYQVLVDSNFLQAVHNFKMELLPALERTLQGKPKPLLTKCSLAALMAKQPINPKTNQPYRPHHLPPPTELPLRHCSHNAASTPIDEVDCLLSLLSPSTDAKKNKEHYILATADPPAAKKADKADNPAQRKRKRDDEREEERALRRSRALRSGARSIPGVPIIYVKRSVMVLEPLSTHSETVREGHEKGKFRAGLDDPNAGEKRKFDGEGAEGGERKKISGMKKAKGPNPLSMKKSKKQNDAGATKKDKARSEQAKNADAGADAAEGEESGAAKPKRRRRHHKGGGDFDGAPVAETGQDMEVE